MADKQNSKDILDDVFGNSDSIFRVDDVAPDGLQELVAGDDLVKDVAIDPSLPTLAEAKARRADKPTQRERLAKTSNIKVSRPVRAETFTDENDVRRINISREFDNDGNMITRLPILDIPAEIVQSIRRIVGARISLDSFKAFSEDEETIIETKMQIRRALESKDYGVPPSVANIDALYDEINGFGPLSLIFETPFVTDIIVSDYNRVTIGYQGSTYIVDNIQFRDLEHYANMIEHMVSLMNQKISTSNPYLDFPLPDGSRVNVQADSIAEKSKDEEHKNASNYFLCIRRFSKRRFRLHDMVKNGTISAEMAEYLHRMMRCRANVLLVGSTSSGKTAMMEAILAEKNPNDLIITCEDTRELQLPDTMNVRYLRTKRGAQGKNVTIRDLVRNTLRMAPDSIIIGETRDATAYDIILAMNSGHDGCCTTLHANSGPDGLAKFESYARMADDAPVDVLRSWIADCIDVVIFLKKTVEGKRIMMTIDEIVGYDEKERRYITRNFSEAFKVNLPDEEPRYEFYINPEYYTTDSLVTKLRSYELPYVDRAGHKRTDENSRLTSLRGASEKARRAAAKAAARGEVMQYKESQREADLVARRQAKMVAKEKEKEERLNQKRKARQERKLANENKRVQRRLEIQRERAEKNRKQKTQQAALHQAARKRSAALQKREQSALVGLDELLKGIQEKQVKKFIAEGMKPREAQIKASLETVQRRREVIESHELLTDRQKRRLPKAIEYYKMLQNNMSPEEIAAKNNISVGNVLSYLALVEPTFAEKYRVILQKRHASL